MVREYTKHPVYGYLTAQEYEQAKRDPYGYARYWKKIAEAREKEAKKQKGRK